MNLSKYKGLFVLIFFIFFSFFTAFLENRTSVVSWIAYRIAAPIQYIVVQIDKFQSLERENTFLKQENDRLTKKNHQYFHFYQQYQKVSDLLNFKNHKNYPTKLGSVMVKSSNSYDWVINLGSQDNVKVNMPVFTSQGIVGKIVKVFKNFSLVGTLYAYNSRVSVKNIRSKKVMILQPYGDQILIVKVSSKSDVIFGDTLYTSGFGGVFPENFPVGVVGLQDLSNQRNIERYMVVEPFVNLDYISKVFVYLKDDIFFYDR